MKEKFKITANEFNVLQNIIKRLEAFLGDSRNIPSGHYKFKRYLRNLLNLSINSKVVLDNAIPDSPELVLTDEGLKISNKEIIWPSGEENLEALSFLKVSLFLIENEDLREIFALKNKSLSIQLEWAKEGLNEDEYVNILNQVIDLERKSNWLLMLFLSKNIKS